MHKAFESSGLNGLGVAWGVEERGAIVYEAMFREATAKRLAELCDTMPRSGWHGHRDVLEKEGYALDDPGEATPNV